MHKTSKLHLTGQSATKSLKTSDQNAKLGLDHVSLECKKEGIIDCNMCNITKNET